MKLDLFSIVGYHSSELLVIQDNQFISLDNELYIYYNQLSLI